jgi:aspartyl-tRNA(Asn)/glutamyl-tRNA(Gln) amidotransferase subunit A
MLMKGDMEMDQAWTVARAGQAVRAGEISAVELAQTCLERIAAEEDRLHAFVTVAAERVLEDAARADAELRAGRDRGPLHGIPFALKDLIETRGIRTTASSDVLADFVPEEDADIVQDLTAAGMALLGKTNTQEFAWGVFTPPTRNPWDTARIAGGSSGGSAAAVAAGETVAAIGTDTGGSIRIPAACCGVTGLKPTYGRVSLRGIIPLSDSLDHAGPIARTVEDCALIMDAIAEPAYRGSHAAHLADALAGVRVRLLAGPWADAPDPRILAAIHAAAQIIAPDATAFDAFAPMDIRQAFSDYRSIQSPEAVAHHTARGWYPDRADRYTPTTRDYIERGAQIPAVRYVQAKAAQRQMQAAWRAACDAAEADIFLAPTLPILPPTIAATRDPAQSQGLREALLGLTFPFDMLGVPVLALPCGMVDGLPVSMQIIGRWDADALVLRVGHAFQQQTDWHLRQPAAQGGSPA